MNIRHVVIGLAATVAGCGADAPNEAMPAPAECGLTEAETGQFVSIPAGRFTKGDLAVYPEESPSLQLHVDGFEMLSHEVTNREFAAFVDATGYVTDAERSAEAGGIGAGSAVFVLPGAETSGGIWSLVRGATWRTPEGPGSDLDGRWLHPVVHVTLADARAYADWAGGRLPSEVEWEYAASLGLPDPARANSGAYDEDGAPVANTWQGVFPVVNIGSDGFRGTAPAGCFGADRAGLYDMIGNVWELTDTPYDGATNTIKGGSYLCAENFCRRYRPAARQPQERDFSTNHVGFRIVRDPGTRP